MQPFPGIKSETWHPCALTVAELRELCEETLARNESPEKTELAETKLRSLRVALPGRPVYLLPDATEVFIKAEDAAALGGATTATRRYTRQPQQITVAELRSLCDRSKSPVGDDYYQHTQKLSRGDTVTIDADDLAKLKAGCPTAPQVKDNPKPKK